MEKPINEYQGIQIINLLLQQISPTPNRTLISINATSSGSVPASLSVSFYTSAGFVGTINGVAAQPNTVYSFNSGSPFRALNPIPYTISSGSIRIDRII